MAGDGVPTGDEAQQAAPVQLGQLAGGQILRRQEDVLGQEVLYYHTGSAYGVYSLMTYNPETKNGVVVITTGARRNMNERGMYALCADLMELLYEKMGDQLV